MTREKKASITLELMMIGLTYKLNGNEMLSENEADSTRNAIDALDVAITALCGPQPDPDTGLVPCDFCTDTFDQKPLFQENKYKPYTRMMSTISIEENNGKHQIEIDLWDGVNIYAAFEINFCPMCGRKLDGV